MSKNRHKDNRQKREQGAFVALPRVVLRSAEFASLTPIASKLILDLLAQYRGDNNGDLCATWSLMSLRGWRSKDQLSKAIKQLCESAFLVLTRRGGRHTAALYGVTFYEIDWCQGKLDFKAPTRDYMGTWQRLPAEVVPFKAPRPALSLPRPQGQSSDNCPAHRVNSGGGK